ncbi:PAS domain-containing protein [Patulibacter sp.]|uniref:PAS domain-containing protein n=1 Tax=Patulibacter sp. TaxID=1912859 RepID=UPI0027232890|nr:PAS domain-containing protein [Patulibacter sp.]MDO9410901.1 PAS domain-containing protein [Patulibacter sp.]
MFSVSTLTIGDVGIVVRPISSSAQLRETLDAVSSIRGIDRAAVDRVHGDTAHLKAHAERPVALASELRSAFRQRVVSCTASEGRIVVELAGARPAPGADDAPRTPRADGPPVTDGPRATDGPRVAPTGRDAASAALDECDDVSVLHFDLEQRFTAAAGGMHRRLGHDFEQLRGRTAKDVVPAGTWWLLRPAYADALAGRTRVMDVPLAAGLATYEATFRPVTDDGVVTGGTVTVRDVTRQRVTERALAESTAVLAAVLDASDTPFGLLAPNGRWARVNAAMLALLDEDEATMLTSNLFDRTRPDETRVLERALTEMIDNRCDHHLDGLRVRRRHGEWIDVSARLTAVRSGVGLNGVVVELRPGVAVEVAC